VGFDGPDFGGGPDVGGGPDLGGDFAGGAALLGPVGPSFGFTPGGGPDGTAGTEAVAGPGWSMRLITTDCWAMLQTLVVSQ
jgi:hypothetical protein